MYPSSSRLAAIRRILLLFILLLLFMAIAVSIQTLWLGASTTISAPLAPSIRWMQLITTICTFLLPALGWARVARRLTPSPLSTARPAPLAWLIYGLAVALLMAMPNALLTEINAKLPIPEWAADIDKRLEEASKMLLSVDSFQGYITNVLVIAIAPAVCEELFFRGALQQDLLRITKNPHTAIWIGAAIFSLIHFQLSGCIPRLALGAALGYLAYYSRSIWPSVVMHFTNNFTVVSISAIAFRSGDIAKFDNPTPWVSWPTALLCMLLIIAFFIREEKKRIRS